MEIKTYEDMIIENHKYHSYNQYKEYSVKLKEKWVKVSDVQEIQFQVQKWCISYFDMSTKEIIKLNKLLKIKELKGD